MHEDEGGWLMCFGSVHWSAVVVFEGDWAGMVNEKDSGGL